MAPGSSALALKAAAVAAVLAMLVVPSLGRCGHSQVPATPPPPAPTPSPPPPPPPPPVPASETILCDDCEASIASICHDTCNNTGEICGICRQEDCSGTCNNDGGGKCNGNPCTGSCDVCNYAVRSCDSCRGWNHNNCYSSCIRE